MGPEVIILPIIFAAIFGVFYLYFSTRNKERLALIEKGADASIFMRGRQQSNTSFWKVLLLNLALLLMGVGIGVFMALLLTTFTSLGEDVYPATIFFMAGAGLFIGFNKTKDLDKE